MSFWTMEDGLKLVRALQPEARKFGYHLSLGGSVLNQGHSHKDIDLYFLPFENKGVNGGKSNLQGLVSYLEELWGVSKCLFKDYGQENLAPKGDEDVIKRGGINFGNLKLPKVKQIGPGTRVKDHLGKVWWRWNDMWVSDDDLSTHPNRTDILRLYEEAQAAIVPSAYQEKLKFTRGDDRIDVFIL